MAELDAPGGRGKVGLDEEAADVGVGYLKRSEALSAAGLGL